MYNQRVHVKLFFFVIIVIVGMTTTVTFSRQNDAARACTTFSYLVLKISRPCTKPRYKYRDIF